MAAVGMSGGSALERRLTQIADRLSGPTEVRIGFLESSGQEPGGLSTPVVAALNEFGGTVNMPAHDVTVFRKVNASGDFMRGGRFVKRSQSNFSTTHAVAAYTITRPPRPFFRTMIAKHKAEWAPAMAALLKQTNFSAQATLLKVGDLVAGQLRQSIIDLVSPPLADSTIARKARGGAKRVLGVYGPAKPLVETGHMLNSVDYETS